MNVGQLDLDATTPKWASTEKEFLPNVANRKSRALYRLVRCRTGRAVWTKTVRKSCSVRSHRFERAVPVFPRRPGATTLSVEDVDRLADGLID